MGRYHHLPLQRTKAHITTTGRRGCRRGNRSAGRKAARVCGFAITTGRAPPPPTPPNTRHFLLGTAGYVQSQPWESICFMRIRGAKSHGHPLPELIYMPFSFCSSFLEGVLPLSNNPVSLLCLKSSARDRLQTNQPPLITPSPTCVALRHLSRRLTPTPGFPCPAEASDTTTPTPITNLPTQFLQSRLSCVRQPWTDTCDWTATSRLNHKHHRHTTPTPPWP